MGAVTETAEGLRVGPPHLSTDYSAIFEVSASLTPASVGAATSVEQTFNPAAFAGVRVGDSVILVSSVAPGTAVGPGAVRVTANGTIGVRYVNPSAGALVPTAGTYIFQVWRRARQS